MKKIDLNCDLGESFGAYRIGRDAEILRYVTSANIACGLHAGDPTVMEKTVAAAIASGVSLGAHPGYPDMQGFGRRAMNMSAAELEACVLYQLGALSAFAAASGKKLSHIKPHGAMYNTAVKDIDAARAISRAAKRFDPDIVFLAPAGSCMERAAAEENIRFAGEVFADRAYMPDGSLVPRSRADAMITDENEATSRVIRMITEGRVKAADGTDINIRADSVCVHGDSEKALSFVMKICSALAAAGIKKAPLAEVIE